MTRFEIILNNISLQGIQYLGVYKNYKYYISIYSNLNFDSYNLKIDFIDILPPENIYKEISANIIPNFFLEILQDKFDLFEHIIQNKISMELNIDKITSISYSLDNLQPYMLFGKASISYYFHYFLSSFLDIIEKEGLKLKADTIDMAFIAMLQKINIVSLMQFDFRKCSDTEVYNKHLKEFRALLLGYNYYYRQQYV